MPNKADFDITYTKYHPRLIGYARTMVGQQADDAAQITLFNFWLQPDRITHESAWLFHVCRNVCYNMLHMAVHRYEFPSDELDSVQGESAYDAAVRREDIRELLEALNEMPTIRKDIVLTQANGYSIDEIARQFAMRPGAVRQSLWRSRFFMRRGHEAR